MKQTGNKHILPVVTIGVWALLLFLFYFLVLPHHLFHREQTQLFIWASEPLRAYWQEVGALAKLMGDWLTQFFYYEGAGPAILMGALLFLGVVVALLVRPWLGRWTWLFATIAVLWEAGRLCGLEYPLSGTLALTGIGSVLLLCRYGWRRWGRRSVLPLFILLILGYYLFGVGHWSGKFIDKPNLRMEELLAVDTEVYFGRIDRAREIIAKTKQKKALFSYYYNLINAREGRLPDGLMDYYQPITTGLLIPVTPNSNYIDVFASNEAWFDMGDMTMAEHAAILGMIFSPRHTGTRAMRRLAEINLVNGDEAAALKYLRLLQKTVPHREWAERRMPGQQTPEVQRWLEMKRTQLARTDTVRLNGEVPRSLRNILRGNPQNRMVLDYLLCYNLLNKDIDSFAADYKAYAGEGMSSRLYAEAMLIYLAANRASEEEVARWHIPPQVMDEFKEYSVLYEAGGGHGGPLQRKFGKTYWFYFHYATKKVKE